MPKNHCTPSYCRERKANPSKFAPKSFRTVTRGSTKVVVACPRGHWKSSRCTVGMRVQTVLHSKNSPKCNRCRRK